ncbi:MAG: PAS domain S-box protein [Microcoleus sp.]
MKNDFNNQLSLKGYQVTETLYQGTKTEVCRARRLADKQAVVIKILRIEYPTFGEMLNFRNQYIIAKNLQNPGIVSPLCLETYRHSYALVMEDFGGISLREYTKTHTLELTEFLEIALQLSDILHYLYQNRIIHKDIKPANILIHPETKQVKLIDFSISSLLPKETPEIKNPSGLEGTLAYISPEQTGRMNRGIDYRSDFYSLGVTLFELLTGELPFQSDDPMELVHCHIAKIPPLVIGEEIPQVLGDLVMKLMAKNAEDRYQSALGLKHDIEKCLKQLQETGNIVQFELGERDICDRFIIPEKLYGRESEVRQLLEAFERVANPPQPPLGLRGSEMMLVAGFSGIGKTAVVNEVHKPIVRQRGYFIKGKFDQFNRNIPLSAFVQAFRDLIGQLLSESDAQLQRWKAKIIEVLGDNAQAIVEVIPELERIIGKQPIPPELSGTAAQNRFNLLFQKFIQVFTTKQHPLAIFLDDLQWADLTSLKLLQLLMQDTGHLLVLGAYRDNEVFPAHPFLLTVHELVKNGSTVNTITLPPLSWADTNQLVADTLKCGAQLALPLTELLYQKTQGNPFFATQFLKALHEDKLITFHPPQSLLSKGGSQGGWQCDIAQVKALALTDDVVEFMALQLEKLPSSTQEVLKLAACIGAQFELNTLAIVSQKLPEVTAALLWQALQSGLIIPVTEVYKFFADSEGSAIAQPGANATYKFLHDRVQQAAYSLIPESQRAIAHYQIGQLLLQQISPSAREESIFELVNQLNYGTTLIAEPTERDELAQLNLSAARKARSATAYQAACEYATVGLKLLGTDAWQRQYQMTLALHELAAEIASLLGDFEQMNQWIATTLHHAKTPLEQVQVYQVKIQSLTSGNEFLEAIATGQSVLKILGVSLPDCPKTEETQLLMEEIAALIGDRAIEKLIHLPAMVDAQQLAVMKILANILPACAMSHSPVFPVAIGLQVKFSIQHGNSPVSAFGYANYGFLLNTLLQNFTEGKQFGQLAYHLAEETNAKYIKSATFLLIGQLIHHRTAHMRETLSIARDGYQAGLDTGNLEYAGYNGHGFCLHAYWCGEGLIELESQICAYRDNFLALNQIPASNYCLIYWETVLRLLGNPQNLEVPFLKDSYEQELVSQCLATKDSFRLSLFYIYRFTLNFLLEDLALAEKYATLTRPYLPLLMGNICEAVFYFYDSLTALAGHQKSVVELGVESERVQENQAKLQQWADHAPMNHLHKYYLVEAEKYRVGEQYKEAIELYDRAIALAQKNKYIQEEALANELAAKFYLDWGKEKVAAGYMQEAYYCYARWGAKAKVEDLEKRYPQLLQPILQERRLSLNPRETIATIALGSTSTHTSSSSISDALDFASALKAAQAISSSIELDELMASLTRILLENSGAKKVALVLLQDETWQVRAVACVAHHAKGEAEIETVLVSQSLDDCKDVPRPLIHYVKNTQNSVIVDRLKTEIPGLFGEYMLTHKPQSVLGVPIINQGHLLGVLYLENQLTGGVFTSDRLQVINLLSTQAAIALQNAQLYAKQQEKTREISEKEEEYRSIFESVNDGLSICDLETGKIVAINPALGRMFGYTQQEWLSLRPIDFMHPDSLDSFGSLLATLRAGEEFDVTEGVCRRKDGSFFDCEAKALPFVYKGKLHGLSILRDITKQQAALRERLKAEAELAESEAYHRRLFEQCPIGLLVCRMNGQLLYANAAYAKIVGRTHEELASLTYLEITPQDYIHMEQLQLQSLETIGCYGPYEKEYIHKDGHLVPVRLSGVIVERYGERFIWSSVEDITDRKQAELAVLHKSERLEQALEELQRAQLQMVQSEKMSALGNLVAGVAHEMNNPLGFISVSLQQLQPMVTELIEHLRLYQENLLNPSPEIIAHAEEIDLEYSLEDLPKVINSMAIACDRLKSISVSLRTFSRGDKDYKVLFNIHEGIDSTILILKHRLKASESRPAIAVITEYGNLPTIECFPGQLNQVFMNILANAIDALEESNTGRKFEDIQANPNRIVIKTSVADNQVQVTIADNGKGMSQELQQKIFDHLFTTKGVGKGTGLGLAIARQIIVEKHGGIIETQSTLGTGTKFMIKIPIHP